MHDDERDVDRTDPLAWEPIERRTAYECEAFAVVSETVRLPNGETTAFDYLSEPPAVVVLPLTPDGDAVVIEEWREAVGRVNRGLPAGTVEHEDGDDLERAARRELAEETGYEAETVERLTSVEPANGLLDSVHHHFVARGCRPTADRNLDDDESIRVTTTPYDDLVDDVRAGAFRDGRSALCVLYEQLCGT